jgi:hypothetical protein
LRSGGKEEWGMEKDRQVGKKGEKEKRERAEKVIPFFCEGNTSL